MDTNKKRKQAVIITVVIVLLIIILTAIGLNSCSNTKHNCDVDGHTAEDDGDCNTALYCDICNALIREAGVHLSEDDGNCTTEQKCSVCGTIIVEASAEHIDMDEDFECDNDDCQIILEGAPKDNNEGIDLPIDKN